MSQEFTFAEVAKHNVKKDIYVVIHDKVYNASAFVDEHPGGEEVLLDVAGQEATEAFEDVGHSDEAREILEDLHIGTLKRMPGDPAPKVMPGTTATVNPPATGMGSVTLYFTMVAGGAIAFGVYKYLQAAQETSA